MLIRVLGSILLAVLTLETERWVGRHEIVLAWPLVLLLLPLRGLFDALYPYLRPHDELSYLPFVFVYYYLWLRPLSETDRGRRRKKLLVSACGLLIVVALYWLFFLRLDFD